MANYKEQSYGFSVNLIQVKLTLVKFLKIYLKIISWTFEKVINCGYEWTAVLVIFFSAHSKDLLNMWNLMKAISGLIDSF